MIIIDITTEELFAGIRTIVQEEMAVRFNRPVSRREIAELWNVCLGTVDNIIKKEDIKSVTPASSHPKYSMNDVMNYKTKRK